MGPVTIGVDIGQKVDPTAIAVVEAEVRQAEGRPESHYTARFLERLPLGTPYPAVAERVAAIVRNLRARAAEERAARPAPEVQTIRIGAGAVRPPAVALRLYVDATGVGQPVVDLLAGAGVRPVAVYFTHGDRRTAREDGSLALGKGWLVSRLQAILQTRRLALPRTAEAEALATELLDYEIRVDQDANDTYGAFKVGSHDDLVTALGLAVQEDPPRAARPVAGGSRPLVAAYRAVQRMELGIPTRPRLDPRPF